MSRISVYKGGAVKGASNKKVFIATPTYTGDLGWNHIHSLMKSFDGLREKGVYVEHTILSYNCHVDDSRNHLVRDFLVSDCDELVFLDADVAWESGALERLIDHDRDIVAGVYPKRGRLDPEFPVHVEPGVELWSDEQGLVEVSGAPTGFMKIKRHVLEKMRELNKHRRFQGRGKLAGDEPYTIIFERTLEDGQRWSGDYNFCRIWRKMGGKVYVDPYMKLSHMGEEVFTGTLGDYWKKAHGVDHIERKQTIKECFEAIRNHKATPEIIAKLKIAWNNPYSADEGLLFTCYELAKKANGTILETGCGLTTVVMALANPKIEIHCLEHDAVWASALNYICEEHEIKNIKMHFGPLKEYEDGKWYSNVPKVYVAIAICDGPPRRISNRAIFYRECADQIENAVVLMDDADDENAVRPIKNWSELNGRKVVVLGENRRFAISSPNKTEALSAS